jgi:hypothetical protein
MQARARTRLIGAAVFSAESVIARSCDRLSGHDRTVHNGAGWIWTILDAEDHQLARRLELEQLDSEGRDWFADGPGGAEIGSLSDVLIAAAGPNVDTEWIDAVVAAIGRQLAHGDRGSSFSGTGSGSDRPVGSRG